MGNPLTRDDGYKRIVKIGLSPRECESIGGKAGRIGDVDVCFMDVKEEGDSLKIRKPEVTIEEINDR